ncbi:efflux RND transporter periplasmic adaptor subunit [candidate division KSB1 bacterium]
MKKLLFLILAGAVVVFVILGVQASIERARTTVMTIEDYQAEKGIPVVAEKVEIRNLRSILSYTGTIKGIEQADVSAAVNIEKVLNVHVTPGQTVRRDQLLISLDDRNTSASRRAQDALEDARRDFERTQELFNAGAVSQQVLDKAELLLKAAQAEVDAVAWRHKVSSPLAGTVTDVFVEKGQTVTAGTPLVRVAQLDRVLTEILVAETDITKVRKRQSAVIRTRSFADIEFTGAVTEIAFSTDPDSRNFTVKIEIPNGDGFLKPGMFVDADLVIEEVADAVAVPVDALVNDNGAIYVFVLRDDSTAQKVRVEPGIQETTWVEIPSGLGPDDTIVVEGHNKLTDGVKVEVVSE